MTIICKDCLLAIHKHFSQLLCASKHISKTETQVLKIPEDIYNKFYYIYKLHYACNVFLMPISHVRVLTKIKMLVDI